MSYLGTKPGNAVVTSEQIADGVVAPNDLSTGHPSWDTSGNVTNTKVISTNDATLSGLTVGKGAGSEEASTVLGSNALSGSNTGVQNTAVGYQALKVNTSGGYNIANGAFSLFSNTTGSYNFAVGVASLYTNTTGSNNVGIGYYALVSNTTASNNTAVGFQAGYSNTTSTLNTLIGYQAGYSQTVNGVSTFIGAQAGYYSTGGVNVCVGYASGYNLTTGTNNTFIGNGSVNPSGYYVTTGSKNTILGGYNGNQGGLDIRTSSNYIVLSDGDGNPRGIFDSSGNFMVGKTALSTSSGTGFEARATGKVSVVAPSTLGDTYNYYNSTAGAYRFYITNAGVINATSTTITAISDQRLKENVRDLDVGLAEIMQLQPRKYDWKEGKGLDKKDAVGFIAQEFETVFPNSVGTTKAGGDGIEYKTVCHEELIPAMVKAIQELKAQVDDLKAQLNAK